jgi:hypothetical protein
VGAVALVATAAALVFVASFPAICPLRLVARVPCPTCGLTRATRLALAGDVAGATHLHPLWFVVVPWVVVVGARELFAVVATGELVPLERWPRTRRSAQVLLTLLVLVWVARFFGALGGPVPVEGGP